ncbi:MAG: ATP-binding protein [Thermoanaerobaculia bacterium]|nr:ATP-binding protein [Thermoanaerobaculia bacterium]
MGRSRLRVLLVEADDEQAAQILALVAGMPVSVEVDRACSSDGGLGRMGPGRYDALLVSGKPGQRGSLELLRSCRDAGCDAPVLLLCSSSDRALDLAAMENGAAGFLPLDRLDAEALERSIRYAAEAQRLAVQLRKAREELQERVEERSARLETMNTALAAEVAERRRAEQKLRDIDRRKNEFLATLAHELRNPLAPIGHATEILARLEDGEKDHSRAAAARKVIERQVVHLVRLIDDLLDLSRISLGKVGLRPESVTLASVVDSALEATEPLFLGRRHSIGVVLPQRPIVLHGDPIRLAQILTNLLSNAARYTEPGGRVRLEAALEADGVVLRVIDSGIGIPANLLPHIFTMFSRAADARAIEQGGLGIGLALAKQLAELHGGSLTAASDGPGRGSTFTLRLPLERRSIPPPEAEASAPQAPVAPLRVLIVDDNVDAARTLAELLSLEGHESHVAHDGPGAIASAERLLPDVVVLDIGIPGFDGLEVARRLRRDPALAGSFLVALSGWVQPEDLARSREAGIDEHLAKPVGVATLLRLMARARRARRRP